MADQVVAFGMVARWHPHKDHANMIRALSQLDAKLTRDWRCVLVGHGMTTENAALMALLSQYGVRQRVIACGVRSDIPEVLNAIDVHVLASRGEAFPNVVAEAMGCGTPCVVTDVGDAAFIVGTTGWVVPPSDAGALADAMTSAALEAVDAERWQKRQEAARARIVTGFGLDKMVRGYQEVWAECRARTPVSSRRTARPHRVR